MKYMAICIFLLTLTNTALAAESRIYGVAEEVVLPALGESPVRAKLDTGAETSSLGAEQIELFQKDGAEWVRFTPQIEGGTVLELPVARHSRIKRRADGTGNTESIKRPVVELELCLGEKRRQVEVNLADRSRFSFPLLIGTSALIEFEALIDPSQKYLAKTGCQ